MNYSHLYNTSSYSPPSIKRKMQEAAPSTNTIGGVRVNGNQAIGGVSQMDDLLNRKLRNKDVYTNMKNKAVYSMKSSISAHSSLNSL